MTSASSPAYQGVAPWIKDESQHRRDMARTINGLLIGKMNVTLDAVIPAGQNQVTLTDARIGITTAIIPIPLTADSDNLLAKGWWVDTFKSGSCVIHFSQSNPNTDLEVRLVIIGSCHARL